jgi:UDP-sulfoquinovose synthase
MKRTIILAGVDGYIGNALVQRLLFKGHKVIGIDNMLRRRWVRDNMGSFSATSIFTMEEKEKKFAGIGDFSFKCFDVADDYVALRQVLAENKPDTIINLAHIPSGPFSQISYETADLTLRNNYIGTNNMLWAIRELCPEAHYITIGTTGEYDHYSNIDIEEGYIKINHNGRESGEMIYPRRPGSIYHSSKTASTYLIDFLARTWGMRCTDVQQSVVFGAYTDEIDQTKIYSRLDSDEAAGTVINRFVVQAVLGVPLTVYGEGKHQRGFLSLNDSVQAMMLAVENPAEVGKTQVWNQLSEWHSMNALAGMTKQVCSDVKIAHIPTPRNEHTGDHYYKYITQKLAKLGYKPTRTIEQEIKYVYDLLNLHKTDLEDLKSVVMPKITWR